MSSDAHLGDKRGEIGLEGQWLLVEGAVIRKGIMTGLFRQVAEFLLIHL